MAIRLMPERQCAGCKRQEFWGCTARKLREPEEGEDPRLAWSNPATLPLTLDDEVIYSCPRQSLFEDPEAWSNLFMFYGFYKKGFLPEQGAVIDQSNALLQLFRTLDQANNECDAAEQNKPEKGDPANRGQQGR